MTLSYLHHELCLTTTSHNHHTIIYHIHCTAFLSRYFLVLISLQSIVWWLKVKTVTVTVTVHTSTKISFSIVFRSTQYKHSSAWSDISAITIPFSLRIPMDFLWISYGKNGGIHQASPSYGPSRRPRRPCSVGWSRRAPLGKLLALWRVVSWNPRF